MVITINIERKYDSIIVYFKMLNLTKTNLEFFVLSENILINIYWNNKTKNVCLLRSLFDRNASTILYHLPQLYYDDVAISYV